MKLFVFALAFTAAFAVQSPITEYLPPVASASAPSQEYLPPVSAAASEPGPVVLEAPRPLPDNVGAASVSQGQLAADGYRYKTVRKLKKYRHRRDVSELNRDYLPPFAASEQVSVSAPAPAPVSFAAPEPVAAPAPVADFETSASVPQGSLAADGYRYKTVRRLRYRHRRDVSELNRDYLPPVAASEQVSVAAPAPVAFSAPAPAPVSFTAQASAPEPVAAPAPVADFEASASVPQGSLAADGYRYKTVRRLRYRHRRDVSELNRDYLPPVAASEQVSFSAPAPVSFSAPAPAPVSFTAQASAPEPVAAPAPVADFETSASVPQGSLAADGYRYKTVRRLKYRHRRDVSELNRDYLPPVAASEQVSFSAPAPVAFSAPAPAPVSFTAQASAPEPVAAPAPVADFETSASVPQGNLAADGYRYKTVRRLKYRHRRDVSELNRDYLPPVAASEQVSVSAPAPVAFSAPAPAPVSFTAQASAPEPVAAPAPVADFDTSASVPQGSLAADGYRYKTVRRLRYRHRRDVSELNRDYLPPVAASEQVSVAAPAPVAFSAPAPAPVSFTAQASAPEPVAAPAPVADFETSASVPQGNLAADGYRYKTVRRLKYRHRRDVSELNRDYLPPVAASEQVSVSAPAPAPVDPIANFVDVEEAQASVPQGNIAADGYRYKTVRRLRYRHRY